MAIQRLEAAVRELRVSAESVSSRGRSDGQLLFDFTSRRDETAFAVMVRRHGPMVFGVCRRVLRNIQDAEDAFQATFVVLARKASVLGPRQVVGNWLYGVAYRTALKARSAAARRFAKERTMAKSEALPEKRDNEALEFLDQELNRLPDRYRAAIVLCDLEGKSYKDAARQLDCAEGTVASRLARGRALLANRLTSRGVNAGGIGRLGGIPQLTRAAVPSGLAEATLRCAVGTIPPTVLALVNAVVKGLLMAKLKIVAAGVVCVGVMGFAFGSLDYSTNGPLPYTTPTNQETKQPPEKLKTEIKQPLPERDQFNDPLPNGAQARLGTLAFRHGTGASLDFTPDGKHLISSGGGWVRRWDVDTRRADLNLSDGATDPGNPGFSFVTEDGMLARFLYPKKGEKSGWEVREHQLQTGKKRSYRLQFPVTNVSQPPQFMSPSGNIFAGITGSGALMLWNGEDGSFTHFLELPNERSGGNSRVAAVAFPPDQSQIVVADDRSNFRVIDLSTGKVLRSFGSPSDGPFQALAISSDGRWLASSSWKIHLWDFKSGLQVTTIGNEFEYAKTLRFTPDCRTLVAASWARQRSAAPEVTTWEVASGMPGRKWSEPGLVAGLAVSPDNLVLATMNNEGVIRLWDRILGKELSAFEASPCGLQTLSFDSSGKRILTVGKDWAVREWDAVTGAMISSDNKTFRGGFSRQMKDASGKAIETPDRTSFPHFWQSGKLLEIQGSITSKSNSGTTTHSYLFETGTGKLLKMLPGPRLILTQDGKSVVPIENGRRIQVFNLDPTMGFPPAFEVTEPAEPSLWPKPFAFAPDNKSLVVVSDTVSVVEISSGKPRSSWSVYDHKVLPKLDKPVPQYVGRIAAYQVSPDATKIAFGLNLNDPHGSGYALKGFRIMVMDVATGKLLQQTDLEHEYRLELAFSHNGKFIAAGGMQLVRVWEVGKQKAMHEFDGHRGRITALAFSPDGTRLASASDDSTAVVWSLPK